MLAILLLLSYTYFLASSVAYVAATKELVRDIGGAERDIGELESKYIVFMRELNEKDALAQGYVAVSKTHYVKAGSGSVLFAQNNR